MSRLIMITIRYLLKRIKSLLKCYHLKGGVIIIGSLYWEDETNCISGDELKGRMRSKWREGNLDLENKMQVGLPTRYGRCSSSRNYTYSMILSRQYNNPEQLGSGLAVPFSNQVLDYNEFKRQAVELAKAEFIINENNKEKLVSSWGAIAIWINDQSKFKDAVASWWKQLITERQLGYSKQVQDFSWDDGNLLTNDYRLELSIDESKLDFAFCTYIKPKHAETEKNGSGKRQYPTEQEIAEAMIQSNYQTYFRQNIKNNIRTCNDGLIDSFLPKI
jgi:hypothetical protein